MSVLCRDSPEITGRWRPCIAHLFEISLRLNYLIEDQLIDWTVLGFSTFGLWGAFSAPPSALRPTGAFAGRSRASSRPWAARAG